MATHATQEPGQVRVYSNLRPEVFETYNAITEPISESTDARRTRLQTNSRHKRAAQTRMDHRDATFVKMTANNLFEAIHDDLFAADASVSSSPVCAARASEEQLAPVDAAASPDVPCGVCEQPAAAAKQVVALQRFYDGKFDEGQRVVVYRDGRKHLVDAQELIIDSPESGESVEFDAVRVQIVGEGRTFRPYIRDVLPATHRRLRSEGTSEDHEPQDRAAAAASAKRILARRAKMAPPVQLPLHVAGRACG